MPLKILTHEKLCKPAVPTMNTNIPNSNMSPTQNSRDSVVVSCQ